MAPAGGATQRARPFDPAATEQQPGSAPKRASRRPEGPDRRPQNTGRGPPTAPGGAGSPGSSAGAAPKIGITVMRTLQIGLFPHHPRAGKRRVGVTRRLASGLADACERFFLHWENPALKCSAALRLSPAQITNSARGATRCTFRRWCPTPGLPRSHPIGPRRHSHIARPTLAHPPCPPGRRASAAAARTARRAPAARRPRKTRRRRRRYGPAI